jgi:hypothetical protein
MMRILILKMTMVLLAGPTFSQFYFYDDRYLDNSWLIEAGIVIGAMNSLTDIGGNASDLPGPMRHLRLSESRMSFAGNLGLLYRQKIGVRLWAAIGTIGNDDRLIPEGFANPRYRRNLHFRSRIRELLLRADLYVLPLLLDAVGLISPFISGGIGIVHFDPEAHYRGSWVRLQPLRTEGQGVPYSLNCLAFPFGFGFKCDLNARCHLRLELINRFMNTDYLDDVSGSYPDRLALQSNRSPEQVRTAMDLSDRRGEIDPGSVQTPGAPRGNPRKNDCYLSLDLGIYYVFNRKRA